MTGFMCSSPVYEFDGWTFEYKPALGPWPLTKDYNPRKCAGAKFWAMFSKWDKLTDKEKYATKIGGGCERI